MNDARNGKKAKRKRRKMCIIAISYMRLDWYYQYRKLTGRKTVRASATKKSGFAIKLLSNDSSMRKLKQIYRLIFSSIDDLMSERSIEYNERTCE